MFTPLSLIYYYRRIRNFYPFNDIFNAAFHVHNQVNLKYRTPCQFIMRPLTFSYDLWTKLCNFCNWIRYWGAHFTAHLVYNTCINVYDKNQYFARYFCAESHKLCIVPSTTATPTRDVLRHTPKT